MTKTSLIHPAHLGTLRPLLKDMAITAAEKSKLDDLRRQLAEVEAELDRVSNPEISRVTKGIRVGIRNGTSTTEELQTARALADDARDIRRQLKGRQAEIGRDVAGVLVPLIDRAVPVVERGLQKLKTEAAERVARFLPGADLDALVAADPVIAGITAALGDLTVRGENMRLAATPEGNWRAYSSSVDRYVKDLVGPPLSPA